MAGGAAMSNRSVRKIGEWVIIAMARLLGAAALFALAYETLQHSDHISALVLWLQGPSLWTMLAVSGTLAIFGLTIGLIASLRQRSWWKETADEYKRVRTGPFKNPVEQGEALVEHAKGLYRYMGYRVEDDHPGSRDKGIDVIVYSGPLTALKAWPYRRLSLPQPFRPLAAVLGWPFRRLRLPQFLITRLGIQCKNLNVRNESEETKKRQGTKAGVGAIQGAFAGSPYWDCALAFATVISPSGFSDDAIDLADKIRVKRLNGDKYSQAMGEFKPTTVFWPLGWPRNLQVVALSVALVLACVSLTSSLFEGRLITDDVLASTATLAFVTLSLRLACAFPRVSALQRPQSARKKALQEPVPAKAVEFA